MIAAADDIAAYTVEHGGGTFDSNGIPFEGPNGYAVGLTEQTAVRLALSSLTPEDLARTMQRVLEEWEVNFVGTWVADGFVHIDPVRVLTSFGTAMDLAADRRQRAIYGFAERQAFEVRNA